MGSEIILSNNVTTNAFPTITTVPVGMPVQPGGLRAAEPAAPVRRLTPGYAAKPTPGVVTPLATRDGGRSTTSKR